MVRTRWMTKCSFLMRIRKGFSFFATYTYTCPEIRLILTSPSTRIVFLETQPPSDASIDPQGDPHQFFLPAMPWHSSPGGIDQKLNTAVAQNSTAGWIPFDPSSVFGGLRGLVAPKPIKDHCTGCNSTLLGQWKGNSPMFVLLSIGKIQTVQT